MLTFLAHASGLPQHRVSFVSKPSSSPAAPWLNGTTNSSSFGVAGGEDESDELDEDVREGGEEAPFEPCDWPLIVFGRR